MIWAYPYFRKPPYISALLVCRLCPVLLVVLMVESWSGNLGSDPRPQGSQTLIGVLVIPSGYVKVAMENGHRNS